MFMCNGNRTSSNGVKNCQKEDLGCYHEVLSKIVKNLKRLPIEEKVR